ncbi:MAG: hypothetical protein KIH67_003945 [Candidatus Moranbacteria bacterium]|nr:hypothetical protein [Candidatus Moranbacteria bacterium]
MKEKKTPLKKAVAGELSRSFHEILVADKRAYEPFVKVFQAVGENVSKLDLGSLVGVFEVDEKSEDAAYIVNFLASVAKKEYFNNPRRGPIESFEAALHKVNVALAELVKHGNVSWLGKLHGALAVVEKNNLHFSVTGEGAFLLLRQGQFSEISAGLASSESEVHPLKTFVEVSSGRLLEDDTLLLITPELLALFPLDYLTKQASRMTKEGFRQFLRTALINEIDMAAVMAIEFGSPLASTTPGISSKKAPKKEDTAPEVVLNAWSGNTYEKKHVSHDKPTLPEEPLEVIEPEPKEEFIDEKTGHIYVQGTDISETPVPRFAFLEQFSDISATLGDFFSRTFRRQSKKLARFSSFVLWEGSRQVSHLKRKTTKTIAQISQDIREKQAEKKRLKEELRASSEILLSPEPEPIPKELPSETPAQAKKKKRVSLDAANAPLSIPVEEATPSLDEYAKEESSTTLPSTLRFRSLYQEESKLTNKVPTEKSKRPLPKISFSGEKLASTFSEASEKILSLTRLIFPFAQKIFLPIIQKNKFILIGIVGILVISFGVFYFFFTGDSEPEKTTAPTPQNTEVSAPAPVVKTESTNQLSPEKIFTLNKNIVAITLLDSAAYGATATSVITIESNEEVTVPNIKGEIRYIAPMDDLGLLFLLTSQNELIAWSPSTKTFTPNTLTLPPNTRVTAIGTYLTYLYVLDRGNNQLYRYPRTEAGFTAATNWMKESFELTDTAFLAINETVALAPSREHLLSFVQGKTNGDFVFQDPKAPIAIQALTTDSDFPFIYALGANNTLSVWNTDRKLTHTYTLKDAPKDSLYMTTDPENKTLLVGNKDGNIARYRGVISE